jgi:hypothetical protein
VVSDVVAQNFPPSDPKYMLRYVGTPLLLGLIRDRYTSEDQIADSLTPVLGVHGREDTFIPWMQGLELLTHVNPKVDVDFSSIPPMRHDNHAACENLERIVATGWQFAEKHPPPEESQAPTVPKLKTCPDCVPA